MNFRLIFKLLGTITTALMFAFIICLSVSFFYWGDLRERHAMHGWILTIAITAVITILLLFLGKNPKHHILRKEALCVIGLGWILASLIGALPYLLILPNCPITNAIFESSSGLTTTGASVFSDVESFPRSLLFWRCMSQWIGGLGVVVFFVAILSFLGAGAKILYSHESSAQATDIDASRIQKGVFSIIGLYLFLSAMSATLFYLAGMSPFNAICYMFTALSTGGFATYNSSVAAFNSAHIEWALIVVMLIGGTNFFVLMRILQRKLSDVKSNEEVKIYYILTFCFTAAIALILAFNFPKAALEKDIRQSAFQVVSIITTSGYSSANYELWPPVCHTLLLTLMLIGGCSGSTSGGLKVIRIIIATKAGLAHIVKSYRPRLVRPIYLNRRVIDETTIENIMSYLVLIGGTLCAALTALSLLEVNVSFEGNFSAIMACLFNIGPGFAEIGPTQTYDLYHSHTKLFLSLIMIMGRLELYAIMALFTPSLWKRFS